jgi:hypothetical protein
MRNGDIEVEHDGAGGIDVVQSNRDIYVSLHLNWAEAKALAALLNVMADDVKHLSLNQAWCDVLNASDEYEKRVLDTVFTNEGTGK